MSTHEHAPLTGQEESELRLIEQRLWCDGVRLDRRLGREWPWQIGAVLVAMLGGLMLGSAGSLTHGTVAAVDVAVGTLLVTVAILIAPTAVRRRMVLTASAVRWRVIGRVTALCRAPSNRPPRRSRLRRRGR